MCQAPVSPAGVLEAQSLGSAVALAGVDDRLDGPLLARPNRVPSLGSLLEPSVHEELIAGCDRLIRRLRQHRPTTRH